MNAESRRFGRFGRLEFFGGCAIQDQEKSGKVGKKEGNKDPALKIDVGRVVVVVLSKRRG